jgi:hypothetical protein
MKDTVVMMIFMQKKQCIVYIMNCLKRILIMTNKFFFHAIIQLRLYIVKKHCLSNITTPFFIKVDSIYSEYETMKRYNYKQLHYYDWTGSLP